MCYQKLRRLRDYNIDEDLIERLKEILPEIPTKRVSPLLIAKKLNIDKKTAIDICVALEKLGLAKIRYEITCPECASDVLVLDNLKDIPKNKIQCDICGTRFIPTEDDIWIVCDFFFERKKEKNAFQDKHSIAKLGRVPLKDAFGSSFFKDNINHNLFEINREKLREMLIKVEKAKTNQGKKETLEALAEYLFTSISGIISSGRNKRTQTAEIDVLLRLKGPVLTFHPLFKEIGTRIVIECKNWNKNVGVETIRNFASLLESYKVKFGCLLVRRYITEEAWQTILNSFKQRDLIIVVLTLEDINNIINGANLIEILEEKYEHIKFEYAPNKLNYVSKKYRKSAE